MQCKNCQTQVSITSGSVMHNTKIPIRKWYFAIHLITSSKRGISSKELQRQIGVTYKTAWYVNKRIRNAMEQAEQKYKLQGTVTVDEAFFSGRKDPENTSKTPRKRGRGTNKSKVIVAVSLDENNNPKYVKMSVVENFKAKTIARFAKKNIATGAVISTDGFRAYKSQSLKQDYFHAFENYDKGNAHASLKWLHILISNAKSFIHGTFHGLERGELQSYLNEFCYRFNRRYMPHLIFNKLIDSVMLTHPLGYYSTVVMG